MSRMILVIHTKDFFPFSGEQECPKRLKIMYGYKSRAS